MNIKGLDMSALMAHRRVVCKALKRRKSTERLLVEAITDVPALETLWFWIEEAASSKKRHSRKNKRLVANMEQDFLVLLTLWHMEKEHEAQKPNLHVVGDESGSSSRMN